MNEKETGVISYKVLKPARKFIEDVAEYGLDSTIELLTDGSLLADIPVIKWLAVGSKIVSNFQAAFFVKKYRAFIQTMYQKATEEQINDMIADLQEDTRLLQKIIENVLIDIDRYHTEQKAKMLSILFLKTYQEKKFTQDEYNKIRFSIDLMHPFDGPKCLTLYYLNRERTESADSGEDVKNLELERVQPDFSPLATTGFLVLPSGGTYLNNAGGAVISELGKRFYLEVLSQVV